MSGTVEKSAAKQRKRGRPFQPGRSGNPKGKPRGTRHKLTILAEQLMADEADAVVRKVIEKAKEGDMTAARAVLDRVLPAMKGRPITLRLPMIKTIDDVMKAQTAAVAAMARGDITPDEAATVAGIVEIKRKAIETIEHERRIADLEARMPKK